MSWTDERIERLKELWQKGVTASQIADELGGVSRNAVIGKAHRLGLQSRPSPVKPNEEELAETEVEAKPARAAPVPASEPRAEPKAAPAAADEAEAPDEPESAPPASP